MAYSAQAATIQLSLDAFRLTMPTSRWTLQLRILAKDGSSTLKSVRITNLRLSNISLELSPNADLSNGIVLDGTGEDGVFSSSFLTLLKGDPTLPAVLTFDILDADTGQALTSDDFGLFFYGLLPAGSSSSSDFSQIVVAPVLESDPIGSNPDGNPSSPVIDIPTDPNIPGDPTNPADPTNPNSPTEEPGPAPIPEPSTFLMLAVPLGFAAWRLKR